MPKVHTVIITANGYQGEGPTTTIAQGDSVWWLNDDSRPHSATADDGKSFETGELNEGEARRILMNLSAGVFTYHDRYGPNRGSIVVQ